MLDVVFVDSTEMQVLTIWSELNSDQTPGATCFIVL